MKIFRFFFSFSFFLLDRTSKGRMDGSYKISIELIRVVELLIYGE